MAGQVLKRERCMMLAGFDFKRLKSRRLPRDLLGVPEIRDDGTETMADQRSAFTGVTLSAEPGR